MVYEYRYFQWRKNKAFDGYSSQTINEGCNRETYTVRATRFNWRDGVLICQIYEKSDYMLGGGCAIEIHGEQNKRSITLFKYPGNEPYLMASILKLVFIRTRTESIDKIISDLIDEFGFERVSRLNRRAIIYFYDLAIAKDLGGV